MLSNWLKISLVSAGFVLALPPASAGAATAPAMEDFITHNQIVVDAAPAKIWPRIVDASGWKQASLVPIDKNAGALGAKFKALNAAGDVEFYMQNVEFEPNRLRTMRLNEPNGALIGYASWHLVPKGRSTVVQYDVYCIAPPPADVAANRRRFDAELATLKRLVEARRP